MPDPNATNDAPPPRGPFYANRGPLDGPVLGRDEFRAIAVVADRASGIPIGIAYPAGLVEHRRGPAKTFHLVVNKVELAWMTKEGKPLTLG